MALKTKPPFLGNPMARALIILAMLAATCNTIAVVGAREPSTISAEAVDFERHIQPIFREHCYACHGPKLQESNFRLDSKQVALGVADFGEPPIIAGNSAASPLMQYVTHQEAGMEMPPLPEEQLTPQEIELLRNWIDQGADWPDALAGAAAGSLTTDHWSFQPVSRQPVRRPQLPIAEHAWGRGAIDAFIVSRLRTAGLEPSDEADRVTLIRRLYLDVLGLSPSPLEVEAFVHDGNPAAYEVLVDRVLASPEYGQRWASHWFDVVRFAESDGFETNWHRPNAYRYRDYVIAALNMDKNYDEFIREQIVGDASGAPQATGFLVGGAYDRVKGNAELNLMQRHNELDDMLSTTGTAFLGLTIGCARCHNHKFDPILQKDYYAMQAVFAGVQHGERVVETVVDEDNLRQVAELDSAIAQAESQWAQTGAMLQTRNKDASPQEQHRASELEAQSQQLTNQRTALLDARQIIAYAGTFQPPGETRLMHRGDPLSPREAVAPDALTVLGTLGLHMDTPEQQRRAALADWIADPANPLTARVMVNRLWHYHFGTGLVSTPSDFGTNGSRPSHPELLDWMASEFVASGWSIKHLRRQILLSSTYRQSSAARPEAQVIDADCRLLWRFPPRRLEAEAIHDCMLQVAGMLDRRMQGPGYSAFEPTTNYVRNYIPKVERGPDEWRRMVYMQKIRMEEDAVFGAFDCPDGGQIAPRRQRSTTPLQALNLLNSPLVIQLSSHLAARLEREVPQSADAQVQRAFELVFSREPSEPELADSVKFVEHYGLPSLCRALFNSNESIFLP